MSNNGAGYEKGNAFFFLSPLHRQTWLHVQSRWWVERQKPVKATGSAKFYLDAVNNDSLKRLLCLTCQPFAINSLQTTVSGLTNVFGQGWSGWSDCSWSPFALRLEVLNEVAHPYSLQSAAWCCYRFLRSCLADKITDVSVLWCPDSNKLCTPCSFSTEFQDMNH